MENNNVEKIEWDESKANDKEFLLLYYQNRADYWKSKGAKKTFKQFDNAVKRLKKQLNN